MYKDLVTDLINLPNSCILALVNDTDKRVQLIFSTRMMEQALPSFLAKVKNDVGYADIKNDLPKLRIEILEIEPDIKRLKVKYTYWARRYKMEGYSEYRPRKQPPLLYEKYKLRLAEFHTHVIVTVWLFDKRGNKSKLVGAFGTMEDAEAWCKSSFPEDRPIEPIVASNGLTKAYYNFVYPRRKFIEEACERAASPDKGETHT